MTTATKPTTDLHQYLDRRPAFAPRRRFVVLRRALRKRLGWYPVASFDDPATADGEARYWFYRLAATKYETEFRVVDATGTPA